MKNKIEFLLGIIIFIVTILIMASNIENGDTNAISMYLVVFIIPSILIALLNTIYLQLIGNLKIDAIKIVLSLIPPILLFVLSLTKNISMPLFDGDLSFLAKAGTIALGITNLFWIQKVFKFSKVN